MIQGIQEFLYFFFFFQISLSLSGNFHQLLLLFSLFLLFIFQHLLLLLIQLLFLFFAENDDIAVVGAELQGIPNSTSNASSVRFSYACSNCGHYMCINSNLF